MAKVDLYVLTTLVILAIFIWFRDTSWFSSAADTLPILVALPVFYWIGRPWSLTVPMKHFPTRAILITATLFLIGIITNLTIVLAIAWSYLLWSWLFLRTPNESHDQIRKLMVLPVMAFPWVILDAQPLGWWFRLSGAWVTGAFYELIGFNVHVEGTNVLINELPISVEAACSGMNTLQAMLIAGSVVAFLILGTTNRYWWSLVLIIAVAWLANTLRIIAISALALAYGPVIAMGAFHYIGGWLVLSFMFIVCWLLFYLLQPKRASSP